MTTDEEKVQTDEDVIRSDREAEKRYGKWIVALIVLALIVSIVGNFLLWSRNNSKNATIQEMTTLYSANYFHFDSLTVDSFRNKVASGEEFIVLITSPNCGTCRRMEAPFIQLAKDEGISDRIYHLNVVLLRSDNEAWAQFMGDYGFEGTPTYARFAGGKLVSSVGPTSDTRIEFSMIEQWIEEQGDFFGR